jgi:hypothetical protein
MAIATGTAIALGVSAAMGAGQAIAGGIKAKKAKRALSDLEKNRQELKGSENLRVSTLGAELQAREASRRFATSVDALQSGGVRGVVGGLARVDAGQQRVSAQIAAGLDQQQATIERMKFQEQQSLRQMQESRESQKMGMLMAEQQQGQQQVAAGISQVGSAAMTGLMSMDSMQSEAPRVNDGLLDSNPFSGSYRDYKKSGGNMSRREFRNLN